MLCLAWRLQLPTVVIRPGSVEVAYLAQHLGSKLWGLGSFRLLRASGGLGLLAFGFRSHGRTYA